MNFTRAARTGRPPLTRRNISFEGETRGLVRAGLVTGRHVASLEKQNGKCRKATD
jgi:hypothetical protein